MFSALMRWLKALGYVLLGQVEMARKVWAGDVHLLMEKCDEMLRLQAEQIHQYHEAVAALRGQQEKRAASIKVLVAEMNKLEQHKAEMLAKAKARVAEVGATGPAEARADEVYQTCLLAYQQSDSLLREKQKRRDVLEEDVAHYEISIAEHASRIQRMTHEQEQLKTEMADAMMDMDMAAQEKKLADALQEITSGAGVGLPTALQHLRHEAKLEAHVSEKMTTADVHAQEGAKHSSNNTEWENAISEALTRSEPSRGSLPESSESLE